MLELTLVPRTEFERIQDLPIPKYTEMALVADMCRANTLTIVKRAGSGHLGSSLSAMDIVVWLYYQELNVRKVGWSGPQRDIYFSSKGHDVPGLYAVLYALGVISQEKFLALRRFGGLDGHPDIGVPGIEANSGSLGMGISKGRGMAWAKRHLGTGGTVTVLTGDGEFQEGQNYEALQAAVCQGIGNLTVIMDHNKVQSDKPVDEIVPLGALPEKLAAFGWHVARCDGHDFAQLEKALSAFRQMQDRPKFLIADTLKGRGVSFMEHPAALAAHHGLYPWHAGAPADDIFQAAYAEIIARINGTLDALRAPRLHLEPISPEAPAPARTVNPLAGEPVSQAARAASAVSDEYVANAFGQALVEFSAQHAQVVVLDADLAADCRLRGFEQAFPERFIENGIAEQDMVSMAGGLARQGLVPIVNSFAAFLASRANEQIYNNATEQTKIIYALHYAGLIPAGPGKSHQSIRDISLLGALPNIEIIQPCNAVETRLAVQYAIEGTANNVALRLIIGPSPRKIALPDDYTFARGKGVRLTAGHDALVFGYGPVMLHEALRASEILADKGFGLSVVNMPWLNRIDAAWLAEIVSPYAHLYVVEDHAPTGGLGDFLLNALSQGGLLQGRTLVKFAVEGFPAGGTPAQALAFHGLDGVSLSKRIAQSG